MTMPEVIRMVNMALCVLNGCMVLNAFTIEKVTEGGNFNMLKKNRLWTGYLFNISFTNTILSETSGDPCIPNHFSFAFLNATFF